MSFHFCVFAMLVMTHGLLSHLSHSIFSHNNCFIPICKMCLWFICPGDGQCVDFLGSVRSVKVNEQKNETFAHSEYLGNERSGVAKEIFKLIQWQFHPAVQRRNCYVFSGKGCIFAVCSGDEQAASRDR